MRQRDPLCNIARVSIWGANTDPQATTSNETMTARVSILRPNWLHMELPTGQEVGYEGIGMLAGLGGKGPNSLS
jgi:hypothetical protein